MQDRQELKVKSWITEVFRDRKFEKLNVVFPDYDTKGGFAAEMVFANLIGQKSGINECYHLLVKKSKENDDELKTSHLRQLYINEVNLYSKILPEFELLAREKKSKPFENIPHCYGTIDRDDSYIVIMENLKHRGYRTNMLEKHQDLYHVKLVLSAYAKWHAFSFALKDQKPEIFEKLKNSSKSFFNRENSFTQVLCNSIRNQLESAIQIYREKNIPSMVSKLKKLHDIYEEKFIDFLFNKEENYLVFRHGDCWNNNFLFHYNDNDSKPDDVVIIDWQVGGLGSPTSDLVFYLFYCCSRTELEQIDELLKFYHSNLSQKLIELGSDPEKCFPWNIFIQSFNEDAPVGFAGAPVGAKMSQRDDSVEFDLSESFEDGDFSAVFGKKMKDPEKYFERMDGIFQLGIERGYI